MLKKYRFPDWGSFCKIGIIPKHSMYLIHIFVKTFTMKKSIYQQKGVSGLSVKDGMLINNRPDGRTGISIAVELKNSVRKSEKIATMSAAFALGEMASEKGECGCS